MLFRSTLADLRLTHLDLYLIHWPVVLRAGVTFPEKGEDLVPLEQVPLAPTWAAMEELQSAGLCRHIGVSNFSQVKLQALVEQARVVPAINQVERHPYLQQPALLAYCRERGIVLTAYSPLGSGRNDQPSPVLADPLSGLRGQAQLSCVGGYDLLLESPDPALAPSQVLRLGSLPASRRLERWLAGLDAVQVLVSEGDPRPLDPLAVVEIGRAHV